MSMHPPGAMSMRSPGAMSNHIETPCPHRAPFNTEAAMEN
jgi:hypothetical protein